MPKLLQKEKEMKRDKAHTLEHSILKKVKELCSSKISEST